MTRRILFVHLGLNVREIGRRNLELMNRWEKTQDVRMIKQKDVRHFWGGGDGRKCAHTQVMRGLSG